MIEQFNCRETEQKMNDFIESAITGEDMWYFLNHVLNCPACYEELETRYLLAEALSRVENGETINLRKEITNKIESARFILKVHRRTEIFARTIQVVALIAVAFALVNNIVTYL